MSQEPSFFHRQEFSVWLITSFFTVFVAVTVVILPMTAIHALGTAAADELGKYSEPPKRLEIPSGTPDFTRDHGRPVALNLGGTR